MNDINYIIVTPKKLNSCHYLINDDTHYHLMKYNKLQAWLNQLTDNFLAKGLYEKFKNYENFMIDVKNKKIYELEMDNSIELENLKKEILNVKCPTKEMDSNSFSSNMERLSFKILHD